MSRVFSIKTVLRQTPNRLVREVLARLGHGALPVPWDDLGERDVDPVVAAVTALPGPAADAVEGVFHTIFDLACASGLAAVREAHACLAGPDDPPGLPEDAGPYEQAAWAWLHRPEAVEHAALIHQIDRLAWWRLRTDLPRRPPAASPDALERLGREVSAVLRREEGRGRNCTVEAVARRGATYFFAFPDDFVVNATAHDDDGRLAPRTFRRTFTLVFAFDPAEGALELYARVKALLEQAFARVAFGLDLGEWCPPPAYEPNALRARGYRLDTDPEDHVTVEVRQVRLSFANSDRQVTLRGDPAWPGDTVRMLDEVLDRERVTDAAASVTLVTLCFEFHPVGGGRGGSVTFDVAFPNSCSLRNQRPERVATVMKYLTRWGIHVPRPAGPDLAAAG